MPQRFTDYALGVLRTASTAVAGAIITWLIARGVHIDLSVTSPLADVLFAGSSAAYYVIAGWLERYVSQHFGWLMLAARVPHYRKVVPGEVIESHVVRSRR